MERLFGLVIVLSIFSGMTFAQNIIVENAYVRLLPPGSLSTGAFMVIKNTGDKEVALTSVQNPISKTTEIHANINDNGVMKMEKISKINIPKKSQVELKPGGKHVMMINLTKKLKEGEEIPLTLEFNNGETITTTAVVKKVGATPNMEMHNH